MTPTEEQSAWSGRIYRRASEPTAVLTDSHQAVRALSVSIRQATFRR